MNLFNVYSLFDVTPIKGRGALIYDKKGIEYLDFYGGHAVISIGHGHPQYIKRINRQLNALAFYSNSVKNPLQSVLADLLSELSSVVGYELFLCNSGAEANENALKMASFRRPDSNKVIAFKNGFHGRTSAAVNVTDNPNIQSTFNKHLSVTLFDHSIEETVLKEIDKGDTCAVILEVIQGVGGLDVMPEAFLKAISEACERNNTTLIVDEVQCGYGRSGKFFAYQYAGIRPDIVSMAKGMGNGFPIGGILLNSEKFAASPGLLGTTFGGNHLACAAGIAVLEVLKKERVIEKIDEKSERIQAILHKLPGIKKIKGKGLMIGAECDFPIKELRKQLVIDQHLFIGSSKDPKVFRLLPPLNITNADIDLFEDKITDGFKKYTSQ